MPSAENILAAAPLVLIFVAVAGIFFGASISGRLPLPRGSSEEKEG